MIGLFNLILIFFALVFFPLNGYAIILLEDAIFPELAISSRATAMGNAYICKADDAASSFYNPAGLGSIRKTHFHLSNFHLETNKGWIDAATGGSFMDATSNFFDGFEIEGLRKLLLKDLGKIAGLRMQAMPNFMTRFFSAGYLYSRQTKAAIAKEVDAKFQYASREDHGPYAALNLSLFGGIFKFGVSGIILQRKELIGESDRNIPVVIGDGDYRKGTAIIFTGGSRFTIPVVFLPTFSAVLHNMTGVGFSGKAAGPPGRIRQTIDLGFSITPQIGKTTRIHLELNYKDAANEYVEVSTVRRVLFGLEFDFARQFFMRFGYGDGYGSAGLGIKFDRLEFDLTTYAVDTTAVGFRGSEDRRFSLSLSYGL